MLYDKSQMCRSTVSLGHLFDFFLLLKGVAGLNIELFNVNDFVSQALSDASLRFVGFLSAALRNEVNGLVDSPEGRDIDSLFSDDTAGSDTGGVLTRTSNNQGVNEDFQGISACQEVDDLESVTDDSDGLDLLTGVSSGKLH